MFRAALIGAGVLGAGVGAMLPRSVYRWSVPAGLPPHSACCYCQASFESGLRGWAAFGDRCANCRRSLGPPWPLLSGILATASTLLAWRTMPSAVEEVVLLAAWQLLAGVGLLLACIDIAVRRLPTPIVLAAGGGLVAVVCVAAIVSRRPWLLANSLAAGVALAVVYLVLALLGGGLGMGDVRLAGLLGLALGPGGWTVVLLGAVLPYLLALPSALAHTWRGRGVEAQHLPFGPYLVAGALLAICIVYA